MLNEKIRYCRKPFFNLLAGDLEKEEKKMLSCLSGVSSACVKVFNTTKDIRFCRQCRKRMKEQNVYGQ